MITSRCAFQNTLKGNKNDELNFMLKNSNKKQQILKRAEEISRKITKQKIKKLTNRKQQIIHDVEPEFTYIKINPTIKIKNINSSIKTPHRYKTAIGLHQDNLIVYGGLGCQKDLSWAKYSFKEASWKIAPNSQKNLISRYGHSMGIYKGSAYIYGGTRLEASINQLNLINLKTMNLSNLPSAPFRRKQHAMTFFLKYIIIHGGIESLSEVKNNLFYYDIELSKWSVPLQNQLPYLSHHSMINIPQKIRRKYSAFNDLLGEAIYLFGGLDENYTASGKLLKLKVKQGGEITTEQIIAIAGPEPRYSHCMVFLQPVYICIYGGNSGNEKTSSNKAKGVFNDIFLFNLDSKQWVKPIVLQSLDYRFRAGCCSFKNRMIIFGGQKN